MLKMVIKFILLIRQKCYFNTHLKTNQITEGIIAEAMADDSEFSISRV